ncbi:MAG: hypothetical protein LBN74_07090 [Prevotella sp.]|jgi:hypothetical protein|nr:hypothetical protein [Prevotella sp.]
MIFSKKIYGLLLLIFITSCGDDNKTNNIRYIRSDVVDFNVCAGEGSGVAKVEKSRFDSSKVFSDLFELYTADATISFSDGLMYVNQGSAIRERSAYKFVDSLLYVFTGNVEQYYGRGNEKNLRIRQHYVGYKGTDNAITLFQGIPKDKFMLEDALKSVQKSSVPAGDTIMWCTRESIFR